MSCFSLDWIEHLLIALVVIFVIVGIIKLLFPVILGWFGSPPGGGTIVTILGYLLWGVVAIFGIIIIFDLISCFLSSGSGAGIGYRHSGL